MSGPIAAQWSLNATASDALVIARSLVVAATSDNVSITAILACEAFGNTLAMCRQTCERVENLVLPTPDYATVRFLKVLVGFSKNDCACKLGETKAGLQFLGLATALTASMGLYDSAVAIDLMLEHTASEKDLLPPTSQIKGLLASIEPRVHESGFADDVCKWGNALYVAASQAGVAKTFSHGMPHRPEPEGIAKLVDAFRQLHRIGKASLSKVSIRTDNRAASWIAAFTEWCLGLPPSISTSSGVILFKSPESSVEINILPEQCTGASFNVSLVDSIQGISELVHCPTASCEGLVLLDTFCLELHNFNLFTAIDGAALDYGLLSQLFTETLPMAVYEAMNKLELSVPGGSGVFRHFSTFPSTHNVTRVMRLIVRDNKARPCPLPDDVGSVVQLLTRRMAENPSLVDAPIVELAHMWTDIASNVVAFILTVSLFHDPKRLRLPYRPQLVEFELEFSISKAFIGDNVPTSIQATNIIDDCLQLMRHKESYGNMGRGNLPLMSSRHGQVVWPKIFETPLMAESGFLCLSLERGLIRHKNETYPLVLNQFDPAQGPIMPAMGLDELSFLAMPRNAFPGLGLQWSVTPGDGVLHSSTRLVDDKGDVNPWRANALNALHCMSQAAIASRCKHSPDVKSTIDPALYQVVRLDTSRGIWTSPEKIEVVPVAGDHELRLFALMTCVDKDDIIVRQAACFDCCIKLCKKLERRILIL